MIFAFNYQLRQITRMCFQSLQCIAVTHGRHFYFKHSNHCAKRMSRKLVTRLLFMVESTTLVETAMLLFEKVARTEYRAKQMN